MNKGTVIAKELLIVAFFAAMMFALPAQAQQTIYSTSFTNRSDTIPAFDQDAAEAFNQGHALDQDSHTVNATAPVVVETTTHSATTVPPIAPGADTYTGDRGIGYTQTTTTTTVKAPILDPLN